MQNTAPAIDIGIREMDRNNIAEGLSRLLADTYTLYLKTHYFHWNVTGPQFNTLRTDAFGDDINRNGELSVLGLKHRMQRIELRAGHVPVKVMRFQIQGIGIGQQAGQTLSDIFT